jgi:hypothetical protein
MVSERSVAMAI